MSRPNEAFKKWPAKYKAAYLIAIFVIMFLIGVNFIYAEDTRTTNEVVQDMALETAECVAAAYGAAECAVMGQPGLAGALVTIGALEAAKAYKDGQELWDRMTDRDDNCEHSCSEHGGNDDHEGSNT
jgi:hypothetical protein